MMISRSSARRRVFRTRHANSDPKSTTTPLSRRDEEEDDDAEEEEEAAADTRRRRKFPEVISANTAEATDDPVGVVLEVSAESEEAEGTVEADGDDRGGMLSSLSSPASTATSAKAGEDASGTE